MNKLREQKEITVAILPLLAIILLIGCTLKRISTKTTFSKDDFYPESRKWKTEVTIHKSKDEARFETGKQYVKEGLYEKAVQTFLLVYQDQSANKTYREQALLELGKIYSDILNPQKDYEKALVYFEKLISEFPESNLLEEAQKKRENVREHLETQQL